MIYLEVKLGVRRMVVFFSKMGGQEGDPGNDLSFRLTVFELTLSIDASHRDEKGRKVKN